MQKQWLQEKWKKLLEHLWNLRSLKVRLFVLILVVGTIPSILMCNVIVSNYEERSVGLRVNTVQNQLKILANHLIYYNYLESSTSETINAELEMLSNLYDGRVQIVGGNFKVVKDTYGLSQGKIMISEGVIRCFNGESTSNYLPDLGYIEMTTPITEKVIELTPQGEKETTVVRGVMLTSISNESIVSTREVLERNAIILQGVMLVFIIGLALVLAEFLTRPFEKITQSIRGVKEGHVDKMVAVPDYSETVHIVDAFNQLLGRMKMLDESRQEFVSNVSHELKTPLTSMKVLSDALLSNPDTPAEIYREFMEDIGAEIDRENQIINDLLALVKMDKTAADLNVSAVNMNELTELILKRLRPLARKRDVEVLFESFRTVIADVDEVKMTLIISNLVDNAIKYNKEHGLVKISLNADHQFFTIEVQDTGIGIPEDDLAQIYERFYRVDKSHAREVAGTGLGLAITRNAVLMHKGTITVSSKVGEGTIFVVKIPLTHIVG
ncbi:MAG: HAMP domain-containing histidine kinase [Lachnospiraceae bacterium]|nr:HAMP domain-containing histidine kinase [Lachnospiraceae bacterium]